MDINANIESPFIIKVSFDKFLQQYEALATDVNNFNATNANRVLNIAKQNPILREGFTDSNIFESHKDAINGILQDAFSPILTRNEIKTASVPFQNIIFNTSSRFKAIINAAGKDFNLEIRNMPLDQTYIIACTIILSFCYGYKINLKRPFFYEIPDANGIMRYYKILYNADFIEITPNANTPKISEADFDLLLDNFENIDLWKQKFPPNSYTFKGFVISNIFDVTDDQSISNIKSSLIGEDKRKDDGFMKNFHNIFQSLLGLNDIKVGFSTYNKQNDTFERVYGIGINSYILNDLETAKCSDSLCQWSYNRLLTENKYFSISNVEQLFKKYKEKAPPHVKVLYKQGIKSAIFAPIANNDYGLMGILEIVSEKPKVLNSINANKLVDIMPNIVAAVERSKTEEENLIEAIIQKECTSIHPSVHWKFEMEAKKFIKDQLIGEEPNFNKIAFENVYPLYGQVDIKGSSKARNWATQQDLKLQLEKVKDILEKADSRSNLPIYEKYIFQVNETLEDITTHFQVDSEHKIAMLFKEDIDPLIEHLSQNKLFKDEVTRYKDTLDDNLNILI